MKKAFGEEEIKAQLRELTAKTRHLREELAELVHHHTSVRAREYFRQAAEPGPSSAPKRRRKR